MTATRDQTMRAQSLWRPDHPLRLLTGVVLAMGLPAAAARLADSDLLDTFPGLAYIVALVISTLVGRLLAGTIAVLVSAAQLYLHVVAPAGTLTAFDSNTMVDLAIFAVVNMVMAVLIARTDRARAASQHAHEQVRQAHNRLELIADASRTLAASFDLPANLQTMCTSIVAHHTFTHVAVLTYDHGTVTFAAGARLPRTRSARRWRRQASPPPQPEPLAPAPAVDVDPAAWSGREVITLPAGSRRRKPAFGPWQYRSGLVVPLRTDGAALGALVLLDPDQRRTYDTQDVMFAREMGERVGRAIALARDYAQQAHIAHTLQQSMLPQTLPPIPGVAVNARYQAGAGTEVGGDFYDVFAIDEDSWMVVVGDVCGKGPEAAVVMTLTRATLRALALHEHSPKRLLTMLNEALLAQRNDLRFVTVAAATFRVQVGQLVIHLALAGHPPPIITHHDGRHTPATDSCGMLLGGFTDVHVSETNIVLDPGQTMVFYTDGIEARNMSAPERAIQLLDSLGPAAGDQIADSFTQAARTGDATAQDDLVVVTLQLTV